MSKERDETWFKSLIKSWRLTLVNGDSDHTCVRWHLVATPQVMVRGRHLHLVDFDRRHEDRIRRSGGGIREVDRVGVSRFQGQRHLRPVDLPALAPGSNCRSLAAPKVAIQTPRVGWASGVPKVHLDFGSGRQRRVLLRLKTCGYILKSSVPLITHNLILAIN